MPQVPNLTHVLDEDPDLAIGLQGSRRSLARRRAVAPVARLDPGPVDFIAAYGSASGWLGLLVLDGLILEHTTVLGRSRTQVLVAGDVFCPWEIGDDCTLIASTVWFELLTQSRVALLDADFAERVGPWPEIASALVGRADRRAHGHAVSRGLADYPRVDVRIVSLLWELAEKAGVAVADETVVLPLPLTHRTIAMIVGCERTSVTSALGSLSRDGLVLHDAGGWILHGSLPEQLEFLLTRGWKRPFAVVPGGAPSRRVRGFRTSSTG